MHGHKVGADHLSIDPILIALGQKCMECISSFSLSYTNPFQPVTL